MWWMGSARDVSPCASVVLISVLLAGCHDLTGRAAEVSRDLPTATPSEVGLSAERLDPFLEVVGTAHPGLHSVLIVRHGRIAAEAYFQGWTADRLHEVQSISKGVVSLAVGIALDRGELHSLDQTMVSFFPDLTIQNLDDRKQAITIGDVLRMSTGTDYGEEGPDSPHWHLNRLRRGWTEFWLNRPMLHAPGTAWRYDSGGVIALSAVFQRTTGMHVDEYARRHIFEPSGITAFRWERNAEGHPHAGGGLHLRPRDLAKIGVLILQNGRWGDIQVVPSEWVERSTRTKFRFAPEATPFVGYAYLWWVFAPDPALPSGTPIKAGTGLGGQYLFMIPDHDMVVVVTGWSDDPAEQTAPVHFLYDDILPAVVGQ